VREIALEMLEIARDGLSRRARRNLAGEDEVHFLDPLFAIAASGESAAARMLAEYATDWAGDISRVYEEYSY
jgi:glutamate--cysteine ligase